MRNRAMCVVALACSVWSATVLAKAESQPAVRVAVAEQAARPQPPRDPMNAVLHPSALVRLIDEIGGRRVTIPKARVVAVLNPRVFLVESASPLPPVIGSLDRVLVMIDAGAFRVDAEAVVDSNVKVLGVARTLLGLQTTGEVPWPRELTREVLKRYEIRAAVLASSVQTADGVELTAPR